MKLLKLILLVTFSFQCSEAFTQDLSKHKWENRLLLILTNDPENLSYKKQVLEFQKAPLEFKERKLLVYHITPSKFKKGLYSDIWQDTESKYAFFYPTKADFEVILTGLDGGIKLRQKTLLRCSNLFSVIDRMPMRRQELRNK
ncbi:DUF4174 domain-containing protein [Gaetbulibacter sp. M240]|uniref:DUF4174 domain-containing protein n=1 Tax=Gaetbulibacter sp. M240 TaxID=3126511 RepID=UPI00374FB245